MSEIFFLHLADITQIYLLHMAKVFTNSFCSVHENNGQIPLYYEQNAVDPNLGYRNENTTEPRSEGSAIHSTDNRSSLLSSLQICQKIEQNYWHADVLSEEGAVCVYGGDQWFSYDNQETITMKANYVKESGLGGAMVWALDYDDFTGSFCNQGRYPLLTAISKVKINPLHETGLFFFHCKLNRV